jgi:hypothetical protein
MKCRREWLVAIIAAVFCAAANRCVAQVSYRVIDFGASENGIGINAAAASFHSGIGYDQ